MTTFALERVKGMKISVVGLGKSGKAMVDWLAARGASVRVSESGPESRFLSWLSRNREKVARSEFGGHTEEFLADSDLIVISPGVPMTVPAVRAIVSRGIPVRGELDIALSGATAKVIAVTGTNGKTTTTALVKHLLDSAGIAARVAGNIGIPVVSAVEGLSPEEILVLEVSSFQLDGAPSFHPNTAVLLNVTPDHLDRYPSADAYASSKASIFRNQAESDFAVLNMRDSYCVSVSAVLKSRVFWFNSRETLEEGAGVEDGWIVFATAGKKTRLLPAVEVGIRGEHNLENALAAVTVVMLAGADKETVAAGLRTFKAVEHRLEEVGKIGEVVFVNDSKATNTDAQEKALLSFKEPVVLIAGGRDKGADFDRLVSLLSIRVRAAVLIGEAAGKMENSWKAVVEIRRAESMREAVEIGFKLASPRGTVLLSPGCASFDMFENFEQRGRAFAECVRELAEDIRGGRFSA